MRRIGALALMILLVAGLIAGCGGGTNGQFSLQLVWGCQPTFADFVQSAPVNTFCITVQPESGTPIGPSCASTLEGLEFEVSETGEPVTLIVEGLDTSGSPKTLFKGMSTPVQLVSGVKSVVPVPMAPVGAAMLVAGKVTGCTALPYQVTGATENVFPSGHVLIVGGSSFAGNGDPAALLFDPITLAPRVLDVPVSLHRSGHASVKLGDGRVVVFGGIVNQGGMPSTPLDFVVLNGNQAMMAPYDRSVDYFGPLRFEALNNSMMVARPEISAGLFFGDQILIADGTNSPEMFMASTGDSGAVTINGGNPFPHTDLLATIVPLSEETAVVLGGDAGHLGGLIVNRGARTMNYSGITVFFTVRNHPIGLALEGARAMFLGGTDADPGVGESPVLVVETQPPKLIRVDRPKGFPVRGYTATLLPSGDVLVAGGLGLDANFVPGSTFLIHDGGGGNWKMEPGPQLLMGRMNHTASLLPDGRVLLVGGQPTGPAVPIDDYARSAEVLRF
jgi:hypothetical protein